jgi:hypothetical protein
MEVAAREGPLKRLGGLFVSLLETEKAILDSGETREVVRCERLALDDAEVGLDLVEPTGMDRGMDQNDVRPFALQPSDGWFATMEEPLSTIQNTREAER